MLLIHSHYSPSYFCQYLKQALIEQEGFCVREAAEQLGIPASFLMSLMVGKTHITPEMALLLS